MIGKKFEFGVKPIFPQYAYVIGKKIVVLKKSGNRESNLASLALEKRPNTTYTTSTFVSWSSVVIIHMAGAVGE